MYTGFSRFGPALAGRGGQAGGASCEALGLPKTGPAVVELGRGREEWLPAVCAVGAATGLKASGARRPAGERGGCGSCRWARPARAWELSGAGRLGAV
jgi:hypothetical protein